MTVDLQREVQQLRAALEKVQKERDQLIAAAQQREARTRDAQLALITSEAFNKLILETSVDCIKILDCQGRLLSINGPGKSAMEIDDFESLQGCDWKSLWSEVSHAELKVAFQQALHGGVARFQGYTETTELEPKWWDVILIPMVDAFGKTDRVLSIARDVTEVEANKHALEENELHFRTLANNIPQLAWMADEQGWIFWYNARWLEYTGTKLEQMQGWGWQSVHHPSHVHRVVTRFAAALKSGEPWEDTFPLRSHTGEYRWFLSRAVPIFDEHGKVIRWFGTNTDVTEQLESEQELRQTESKLRLGIEVAGIALAELNRTTNQMKLSREAASLMGFPDEELEISRDLLYKLIHPEDRTEVIKRIIAAEHYASDKLFTCELRIVLPDRSIRWLRYHKQFYQASEIPGSVTRSILAIRDITDEKLSQAELEETRERAHAANRAKSEFLANMSHEIRTPMTAIMGYADLLGRKMHDAEDQHFIQTIQRNGRFLLEIINDILDLSKIEEEKLEIETVRFSPIEIVEEIRSLMHVPAAEQNLPLEIEMDGFLPDTIDSDPTRLRQILVNLVGNAIKFTEKGFVRLTARFIPSAKQMQFVITDTGIGIAEENLTRLFRPFSQTDSSITRRYGGSGLGLAISQHLAKLLGGNITVETSLGKGSQFTVTIDVGAIDGVTLIDATRYQQSESDATSEMSSIRGRVLIVDDRREIRFLAQKIVEESGGQVVLADDGREAVELMLASRVDPASRIDLVVMDMQMPRMDGLQATRALREHGFTLPIIALTAHAMKGDKERCFAAGVDDYLTKPLNRSLLLSKISEHIEVARKRSNGSNSSTVSGSQARIFLAPHPPALNSQPNRSQPLSFQQPKSEQEVAPEPKPVFLPEPVAAPVLSADTIRVLLVEDNRDSAELQKMLFQLAGYHVETAFSGADALQAAKSSAPDVVVMDLGLPDINGYDLIEQLRRIPSLENTDYIAYSGRTSFEDKQRSQKAGFARFVVKPARAGQLEQMIAELITARQKATTNL